MSAGSHGHEVGIVALDTDALDEGVRISVLPSGARVVTDTMAEAHSASVSCWVGAGSRDEPAELAGASHFLEHLLFKGTEHRSARDINRGVDAVGGDFNAYTVKEATVFYTRVPAVERGFASDLLTEIITAPRLSADDVEIERSVILEELAMAVDSPDDLVFMNLAEQLFPGHPLGWEVLGQEPTLESMSRDAIAGFHGEWYQPANLVFAAAGRIDHDEFVAAVEARCSRPGGRRPERTAPDERLEQLRVVRRPIEQVHLALGWRSMRNDDDDRFALAVLNHSLGDGPSSRLYEEIREERGLAYSVLSAGSSYVDSGSFSVYCATAPEHLAVVRTIVSEVIADLVGNGIGDEELAVAKGYLRGSMLLGLEDSGARMSRLGSSMTSRGRVVPVAESLAGIAAVTHEDVRRVARRLFDAPMVTSAIGPIDDDDVA